MRRRRQAGQSISLFAFQDIITGITGVMIVCSLFLVLELQQDSLDDQQPTWIDEASRVSLSPLELRSEIERLQGQVALLPTRDAGTEDLLVAGEWIPQGELSMRIRAATRYLADLETRRGRLLRDLSGLEPRFDSIRRAEADNLLLQQQLEVLSEQAVETLRRAQDGRLVALREEDAGRRPVLIECARASVRIMSRSASGRVVVFSDHDRVSIDGMLRATRNWLQQHDDLETYAILYVRPDALGVFAELVEWLQKNSWDYGYEPLGNGRSVVLLDREER